MTRPAPDDAPVGFAPPTDAFAGYPDPGHDPDELRRRLRLALWGARLATWEWDIPTGRVDASAGKLQAIGFAPGEAESTVDWWIGRIHPDDHDLAMQTMRDHLEGRSDIYEVEYRLRTKAGGYRWFLDRGAVVERDAGGRPLRLAGTVFNIDDRKRAEEQLDRHRNELEARVEARTAELQAANEHLRREAAERLAAQRDRIDSERRAALSVFAAGVAHNFNNIITGALGYAELAGLGADLDDKTTERLGHVVSELRRAAALTDTLLHFCGKRTRGPAGCRLGESLGRTVALLQPQFGAEGIEVSLDCLADPAVAMPQPDADQLALQLLLNARDAVRAGPERRVQVIVDTDGEHGRLRVTDTGCGIEPDDLDAFFHPFFARKTRGVEDSLEAQTRGPGLGLSVCRAIVERSGGALEVQSRAGRGSTFTVRIPPPPE